MDDKTKEAIKRVCEAVRFTVPALENFYPFKEWGGGLTLGLDPSFYQTLSEQGDHRLLDEYKRARACLPDIELLERWVNDNQ